MASGYGGAGLIATITDGNGMQLEGWPISGLFMPNDPVELNEAGDALVRRIVIADDQLSFITPDLDYRRVRR